MKILNQLITLFFIINICLIGDIWANKQATSRFTVLGVLGESASIACEATPLSPTDAPHLILWYKDIFGTPIYSFDMRVDNHGQHWTDRRVLGDRASFDLSRDITNGRRTWTATLHINRLEAEDAGPYRCRVDFREAPTRNVKMRLKLITLPSKPILTMDKGSDGVVGLRDRLRMTCETRGGTPPVKLQWWRESRGQRQPLEPHGEAEVVAGDQGEEVVRGQVVLENLTRDDHGVSIGCSAINTDLVKEPPFSTLNVNITMAPIMARWRRQNSFFVANRKYTVSCEVRGSNPQARVQALLDGRSLMFKDKKENVYNFQLEAKEQEDTAFLVCRADNPILGNPNEAVEDQWPINVHYAPRARLEIDGRKATRLEVTENNNEHDNEDNREKVELECVVSGKPRPQTVIWTKDGRTLNLSSNMIASSSTLRSTLTLSSLTHADAGEYRCAASNTLGEAASNPMRIHVRYAPRCLSSDERVLLASPEMSLELECDVHAFPHDHLDFQWRHRRNNAWRTLDWIGRRVLLAANASDFYSGQLACSASNVVGQQVRPCTFRIREPKEDIRQKEWLRIDHCSARGSGQNWLRFRCQLRNLQPNEKVFLKLVAKDLDNEESRPVVSTIPVSTQSQELTLSNLRSDVSYSIHISTPNNASQWTSVARTRKEERLAVVLVDADNNNDNFEHSLDDPIQLLPVVGVLASVLLLLILAAVLLAVLMRASNRGFVDEAAFFDASSLASKSHMAFNRSLDIDIDNHGDNLDNSDKDEDEQSDKYDLEGHYPFREAIQAPVAVHRIEDVLNDLVHNTLDAMEINSENSGSQGSLGTVVERSQM